MLEVIQKIINYANMKQMRHEIFLEYAIAICMKFIIELTFYKMSFVWGVLPNAL